MVADDPESRPAHPARPGGHPGAVEGILGWEGQVVGRMVGAGADGVFKRWAGWACNRSPGAHPLRPGDPTPGSPVKAKCLHKDGAKGGLFTHMCKH